MSQHFVDSKNIRLNFTLKDDEHDDHDHEEQGLPFLSEVAVPSLFGVPLKYISLVTLAIQNSLLTIIMHYSRVSTSPSRTYSAATAVLLNELLKGFISLVIAFTHIDPPPPYSPTSGSVTGSLRWPRVLLYRFRKLGKEVFSPDCWKLSIPAILYVIQNNLQYVAASNLEAATFQVSYQMKILTTAGFSVFLLRKKLSPSQWLALLCLAIGVGIVQIQTSPSSPVKGADVHSMRPLHGFMAVVAACFTSGLAGVYFEMVLKGSQADLWIRNVQLSAFSLLPALLPIIFSRHSDSAVGLAQLFKNFGFAAWATVSIQVLGGLVTAMVIKYSDNILKGFATSLSIVISFLASVALFDFHMTFTFILGSVIVLIATWLYNQPVKASSVSGSGDNKRWGMSWTEKNSRNPTSSVRSSPSIEHAHVAFSSSARNLSSSSLSSLSGASTPSREWDRSLVGQGPPYELDTVRDKKNRVSSLPSLIIIGPKNNIA